MLVRTPTQMSGYYGADESPIDAEGWPHTGDLGRLDERVLIAVPSVIEAAVIGVPHADLGEEVMAVVVSDAVLTPEVLQAGLRAEVASFAVPSRWKIQRERLPINNTGKIDKVEVKAQVLQDIKISIKTNTYRISGLEVPLTGAATGSARAVLQIAVFIGTDSLPAPH